MISYPVLDEEHSLYISNWNNSNQPKTEEIIKRNINIMKRCREEITELIGHPPFGDEIRLVNSLFIAVKRELNL